jgi:serine/threonine protein kinase/Tfp pilus assembly protein PilF
MNPSPHLHSQSLALPGSGPAVGFAGRALASEIKDLWKRGEPADARAALSRHPELRGDKSVILDLAYEEYCLHLEAGEKPDPDEFCDRFPTFKASLRRLIEAHRFLEENSYLLADGQPVHWPGPSDTFLGFSLLRELGRGAFARVFLAAEPALGGRRVAVKVSLRGTSEAETLGRINHPNIVPVHSVQEDPATRLTVVCMPYLGGATLCDVLDRLAPGAPLPRRAHVILDAVRDTGSEESATAGTADAVLVQGTYIDGVVHLGAQLADALACIHCLGICHRDLKPSNILMTPAGRPMLLDFNLSFDERVADSRLGGTLPYMSPEQLLATDLESGAGPSLIDARSDLFSLGMILYELLTGTHPFGPVPLKLSSGDLRKHLLGRQRSRPRPVRQINPQVDRGLARLVERCLEYNPNDRPQSPAELAAALRKCLTPLRRARRWAFLHPRLAAAAVFLTLATTALGSYSAAVYEPYPQRQLHHGVEAYHQGDYGQAIARLTLALDADKNPYAFFLRARSHLKLGDMGAALLDFERANQLSPDGQTEACLGYCQHFTGQRDPGRAAADYTRAMNAGFATPEVLNNLGFCYLRLNQLDAAKHCLDLAIGADPTLQSAYYNRALIDLERARLHPHCYGSQVEASAMVVLGASLDPTTAAISVLTLHGQGGDLIAKMHYLPKSGIDDIRKAIELGPPTAPLFSDAARLCSVAAQHDPRWKAAALSYLAQAKDLGQDPIQKFAGSFHWLRNDPEFQAVVSKKVNPIQLAPEEIRLVDPMRNRLE